MDVSRAVEFAVHCLTTSSGVSTTDYSCNHLPSFEFFPTAALVVFDVVADTLSAVCHGRRDLGKKGIEEGKTLSIEKGDTVSCSESTDAPTVNVSSSVAICDYYMCLSRILLSPVPTYKDDSNRVRRQSLQAGDIYQHLDLDEDQRERMKTKCQMDTENCSFLLRVNEKQDTGKEEVFVCLKNFSLSQSLYGPLTAAEFHKYYAIQSKLERVRELFTARCEKLYADVRMINLGDSVRIKGSNGLDFTGVLRQKGPFFERREVVDVDEDDIWIGVELFGKSAEQGSSSGTFRGQRYFSCRQNGSMFFAMDQFTLLVVIKKGSPSAEQIGLADYLDSPSSIFSRLKQQHDNPDLESPLTVEQSEDILQNVLRYPLKCTMELVIMHQSMEEDYGKEKHSQNVKKVKEVPGIADVLPKLNYFIVVADWELFGVARDNLELKQARFEIPQPFQAHFQKSSCLKMVGDTSGCAVQLNMTCFSIKLTGTQREIQTALSLLDNEILNLNTAKKSPKRRSRKKKKPSQSQAPDCVICLTCRPCTAFAPCGHKNTCHKCAEKLFKSHAVS